MTNRKRIRLKHLLFLQKGPEYCGIVYVVFNYLNVDTFKLHSII